MNRFALWLLFVPITTLARPPGPAASMPAIETSAGQYAFSLRPKAFQRNPLLDQTVITEMTPAGKQIPPPKVDRPTYYVIQSGGYHRTGHSFAHEAIPKEEVMHALIVRVLSGHGYQPATVGHPSSLLMFYYWGSSNPLDLGNEDTPGFPDVGGASLLTRAALVGGDRFARDLRTALIEQHAQNQYKKSMQRLENSFALGGLSVKLGVDLPDVTQPFQRFVERDDRTRQLVEQVFANCYYVIVSAYDYAAAAKGQRVLLWRTKMTVEADGVSMADTLPGLIVNAGKYFGQDMPEAATLSKRVSPEGHVKLGELEVKGYVPNSEK